tara:strand:- start:205 stop:441 length:237 start_codon:yes stop_codon:yes gene_type:complete
MKTKTIDFSQFELSADDKRQIKSMDKVSSSTPNYKENKRVNLDYFNEDELDDIAVDDYSECDGHDDLKTLGDIGMDVY